MEDRAALDALLDEVLVAHVGVVADGVPLVLPTIFARDGDRLFVHGSTGSGWMRVGATGAPACLTVTVVDGLVVARSAFESSMRYRSAVVFGVLQQLDADSAGYALDVITDKVLPGRRMEVRAPTPQERRQTLVLAMPIEHWSLKVSDGWPDDPEQDRRGDAWAGVVPLRTAAGTPLPAPDLPAGIPAPASVTAFVGSRASSASDVVR